MRSSSPRVCDSNLTVLSVDLLIQILDRVPDGADRKSWRLVCRAFLRAEALHRRSLRVLRREALPSLMRCYSAALERLDLSACPALDDSALATALASSAGRWRLRTVNLSRASGVGWRGLGTLVASCPMLEAVDMSHCVAVGDREAAALASASGLKELRFDKCLGLTDVGLAKIVVGCPALEKLSIKWCLEISDIGIDLLAKKCRNLRALNVSFLKISNASLESISSLDKLDALDMFGCPYIDNEGLAFLNNRKNSLLGIDISRCDYVTSAGLSSVIEGHQCLQKINIGDTFPELDAKFLSKLSTLKKTLSVLKLDGFQVSVLALQVIGASCQNLNEISLSKCRGVTDEGISELVRSCAGLMTIDLTCCNLITDKALIEIAEQCKKVTCLRLESCNLITEKGLQKIGKCCFNLEELDLTECTLSDNAMKYISRCSELSVLKLGLCDKISDEGLFHIASNCNKLCELDLYRCTEITNSGLASIAFGCKKIQKLNLCYCEQITDEGLKHLSSLEELYDLELRGLRHITSLGVATIAVGCKRLTQLDLKGCHLVDDAGLWALAEYTENLRQINISYCPVSGAGLCKLLGTLRCLQDVKLVHLTRVSVREFELALGACFRRLKKVKLLGLSRHMLSPQLILMLQACGCRVRWVDKPLMLNMQETLAGIYSGEIQAGSGSGS